MKTKVFFKNIIPCQFFILVSFMYSTFMLVNEHVGFGQLKAKEKDIIIRL